MMRIQKGFADFKRILNFKLKSEMNFNGILVIELKSQAPYIQCWSDFNKFECSFTQCLNELFGLLSIL